eukprot:5660700-Prymnesium_polylepis.1
MTGVRILVRQWPFVQEEAVSLWQDHTKHILWAATLMKSQAQRSNPSNRSAEASPVGRAAAASTAGSPALARTEADAKLPSAPAACATLSSPCPPVTPVRRKASLKFWKSRKNNFTDLAQTAASLKLDGSPDYMPDPVALPPPTTRNRLSTLRGTFSRMSGARERSDSNPIYNIQGAFFLNRAHLSKLLSTSRPPLSPRRCVLAASREPLLPREEPMNIHTWLRGRQMLLLFGERYRARISVYIGMYLAIEMTVIFGIGMSLLRLEPHEFNLHVLGHSTILTLILGLMLSLMLLNLVRANVRGPRCRNCAHHSHCRELGVHNCLSPPPSRRLKIGTTSSFFANCGAVLQRR